VTALQDLSIRRKVTIVILVGTVVTLTLGAMGLMGFELASSRRAALKNVNSIAQIVGASSAGALVFNDTLASEDILTRLGEDPAIMASRLFTLDGTPLASYLRNNEPVSSLPAAPPAPGATFANDRLN
jgi:hypothetical protein